MGSRELSSAIAALFIALFVMAGNAWAGCGLEACPAVLPAGEEIGSGQILMRVDLSRVSFDFAGFEGEYSQIAPRFEWKRNGLSAGAWLPFVTLSVDDWDESGHASPVLFAERRMLGSGEKSLALGLQVEIPAGGHEVIASDHWEVVPYATALGAAGPGIVYATLGARHGIESDGGGAAGDDHAKTAHGGGTTTPLLVAPHGKSELLAAFGARRRAPRGNAFLPGVSTNLEYVLDGTDEGDLFATGALSAMIHVAGGYTIDPLVEFAIGDPRRFDWAFRLRLTTLR